MNIVHPVVETDVLQTSLTLFSINFRWIHNPVWPLLQQNLPVACRKCARMGGLACFRSHTRWRQTKKGQQKQTGL